MLALLEAGAVWPPAIVRYKLADAAEAHRVSESRHLRGKLVLEVRYPATSCGGILYFKPSVHVAYLTELQSYSVIIPSFGLFFRASPRWLARLRGGVKLLILVVDDEPDVEMLFRQHFRRDLREGRFTMEFAQSGEMALQRIADAAGVSLILILSDINMPGMTGLELLPKAKAARPDVPVIMITAYGDVDTKRKALEGGAEALFTKPIDFGALRSEITLRASNGPRR